MRHPTDEARKDARMRKHLGAMAGLAVFVLCAALASERLAAAEKDASADSDADTRLPRLSAVVSRPFGSRVRRPFRRSNLRVFRSADYERELSQPWSTDWPESAKSNLSGESRPLDQPETVEAINAAALSLDHACPHCGAPHNLRGDEAGPPEFGQILGPDPGNWLFRPFSMSWFTGVVWGDELVRSRVDQHQGFMGGVRFGWDLHEYWGVESRLGFSAIDLSGVPPQVGQNADWFLWDTSVLFYPLGDDRWRPYFLSGMGVSDISFDNDLGQTVDETLFAVVIGVGWKYRWNSSGDAMVRTLTYRHITTGERGGAHV